MTRQSSCAISAPQWTGELCRNCIYFRPFPADRPVLGCGARCRNSTPRSSSKAMARRIAAKQIGDTGHFTNSWLKMNTAPPEFGEAVSPCLAMPCLAPPWPRLAAPRPLALPRLISLTAPPAPAPTSVDFLQMMTAADVVVSFASSLLLRNEDRRHLGWRVGCDRRLVSRAVGRVGNVISHPILG